MKDGHLGKCIDCTRLDNLVYRRNNAEKVRAYDRSRGYRGKPDRTLAHNRARKLERQPCEACGDVAQAHHNDYNKPLDVQWLCRRHHMEIHRRYAVAAA